MGVKEISQFCPVPRRSISVGKLILWNNIIGFRMCVGSFRCKSSFNSFFQHHPPGYAQQMRDPRTRPVTLAMIETRQGLGNLPDILTSEAVESGSPRPRDGPAVGGSRVVYHKVTRCIAYTDTRCTATEIGRRKETERTKDGRTKGISTPTRTGFALRNVNVDLVDAPFFDC